jgi:hypothetical protein
MGLSALGLLGKLKEAAQHYPEQLFCTDILNFSSTVRCFALLLAVLFLIGSCSRGWPRTLIRWPGLKSTHILGPVAVLPFQGYYM